MKRLPTVEFYRGKDGYRWRLRAGNGRIIAESGEGYSSRAKCDKGCNAVFDAFTGGYQTKMLTP